MLFSEGEIEGLSQRSRSRFRTRSQGKWENSVEMFSYKSSILRISLISFTIFSRLKIFSLRH